MHIYLASGNRHKQEEFAAILKDHHICLPADAGIIFDPEETGTTFLENALLKARVLYESVTSAFPPMPVSSLTLKKREQLFWKMHY